MLKPKSVFRLLYANDRFWIIWSLRLPILVFPRTDPRVLGSFASVIGRTKVRPREEHTDMKMIYKTIFPIILLGKNFITSRLAT